MPRVFALLLALLPACDPGQLSTGTDPGATSDPERKHHTPDMAMHGGASPDMAQPAPPPTGTVGPSGGSVSLLHFGLTGDTRPPSCEDTAGYPTDVIDNIADRFQSRAVQFALDLGDHMYVCNNDLPTAQAQMSLYMQATTRYGGTWFMTMGNHECYGGPCLLGSQQANYVASMQALAPIANSPYYRFDVETMHGRAAFVIVADNAWDQTQASWLDAALADADGSATYTIVARHHPPGDTSVSTNADSLAIIRNHKFALLLTGHSHLYKHPTTDGGRDLILGTGGAPLIAGGAFWGYAVVDQQADGTLQVTVHDLNNDASPVDTWSVGPN